MCSPAGVYKKFLLLKAEIFELSGTETWNMAVVEKMLDKLPKTERKLWSQFEEIQTAFVEDLPWKFIRFMIHREINLQSKVVSGGTMNQEQDWRHLSEASMPAPPTLAVAATAVTSWWAGQPGEPARSSPSPCYREGDYIPGTDANSYWSPGTDDDYYAEEDWDSSGVQIAGSPDPYEHDYDHNYDDYRMLAEGTAMEVTASLVLIQPEGNIGWDSRPPGGQQHPWSTPHLRRTCQVRCREKEDHSLADCP
jgi:hypothetical protein